MSTGSEMLKQTKLWQLFAGKAAETAFVTAVESICCKGITISKDINRFFPNFTLHDETHIQNVCDWMIHLLGDKKDDLTDKEAALLVMSACCHDIGMAVSETQETTLLNDRKVKEYLRDNPRTHDAYMAAHETVTDELLRHYVRTHHHERVGTHISLGEWPEVLTTKGIVRNTLLNVCKSHGKSLQDFHYRQSEDLDLGLCAILLRLADILDFDSSRAPAPLFDHLNLANADTFERRISQTEWKKNASGGFKITKNSRVRFNAQFESLPLEMEVHAYIDWVKEELEACCEFLHEKCSDRWKTLPLPRTVELGEIDRNGYQFGDFRLTMDQDRVLELLSGDNLYEDAGVFVRELLQNAIDAVFHRCDVDPAFKLEDALISVYEWTDEEGYDWFRIEDNGAGMDENIITKYFLKVGRSYYESEDYRIAMDNRRDKASEAHTPISRFGIGILSCFMGDKKNNRIEVSTKRYTLDGKGEPGIRLNVDGLHGYYYMACEEKSEEELLKTMHHQCGKSDDGYRAEIGTTICVRCHTYQLGNYGSLKDILDKYVAFPEVRVEYHSPNGTKFTYMTQQELMDWAHSMNPDGPGKPIKQYEWRIPDEYLNMFRNGYTVKWEESPAIVGEVFPLDWCTHNPNICGVFLQLSSKESTKRGTVSFGTSSASFEWDLSSSFDVKFDNRRIEEINWRICSESTDKLWEKFHDDFDWHSFSDPEDMMFAFKQKFEPYYSEDSLKSWEEEFRNQLLPYSDDLTFLGCIKKRPYFHTDIVSKCINMEDKLKEYCATYSGNVTAHNGVFVNFFEVRFHTVWFILLLRGNERPNLDVSRRNIHQLPHTVVCAMDEILRTIQPHVFSSIFRGFDYADMLLSEWHELLKLSTWMQSISVAVKLNGKTVDIPIRDLSSSMANYATQFEDGETIAAYQRQTDVLDKVALSVICSNYEIGESEESNVLTIRKKAAHHNVFFFPPCLFIIPKNNDKLWWGHIRWKGNNYNAQHPLSQWLQNRAEDLYKELPDIFKRIIRAMACLDDSEKIVNAVNACLKQIERYNGNKFNVTQSLFINANAFE